MKQLSLSKYQHGASVTGVILLIIALGLLGKFAVAVIPDYVGDYQLTKLIKQELKKANDAKQTEKQFLDSFGRQLSINANYNTKPEEILIFTNKTPGSLGVKVKYETESQYYGKTYVVNRFEKDITAADAAAAK